MENLKILEYKYSKNYNEVFEDIATLMFCIDLGLSRGVNRRINQRAIESDPVLINGKSYAYQAKYYEDSTKLSQHKKDLMKSIKGASEENVTDLYIFINKDKPDKNHKKGIETQDIQDIEDTAKDCNITLHWWTKSMIESSLDLEPFRYVKEMYFRSADDDKTDYSEFYEYVYKRFTESPKSKLFGDISLQQSYIEPSIEVNGSRQAVHEYLESWVNGEEKVAVISGEPGHGKTSLCHKAMCDFYKNGWLAGKVSNVFCFSLNPAMTDAIKNESFSLYSLLNWGDNRKNKKHIVDDSDCKDALILFDGFDELIEWLPKFSLRYFIENEIVPFQKETGAHIVITSRNMAVDSDADYYSLLDGIRIPIWRLQLITEQQQLNWIGQYIEYCRKSSAQKAKDLEEYLDSYKKLEEGTDLKEILGIPIIFRLIVDTQFLPTTEKSITKIYDKLFHATWIKHRRRQGAEEDESHTKGALQNHALKIFVDNNDTAETDISSKSSWLFSFYTTHEVGKRVGFLHRSFYEYFLAYEILSWYERNASVNNIKDFKNRLSYLVRRRVDKTTLEFIKELYYQREDKEALNDSFNIAYELLKKTNGFLSLPKDQLDAKKIKTVNSLVRANNLFWNIVSIGSICGKSVSTNRISNVCLRIYDLSECILNDAQLEMNDLKSARLSSAELSGIKLVGSNLSKADLSGGKLKHADLRKADLSYAYLSGANLYKANLSEANLLKTDLSYSYLAAADLSKTNLSEATLTSADLRGAYLNMADLSEANFRWSVLVDADLSGSDVRGVNLSAATLRCSNFAKADISKSELSNADLISSYCREADFSGANLRAANLSCADLSGASLKESDLRNTNLSYADLREADLSYADLRNANLSYADLREADLSYADLREADLSYADLSYADISGTDFSYAQLDETKLRHVDLSDIEFDKVDISAANFDIADLYKEFANEEDHFEEYLNEDELKENSYVDYQNADHPNSTCYDDSKLNNDECLES